LQALLDVFIRVVLIVGRYRLENGFTPYQSVVRLMLILVASTKKESISYAMVEGHRRVVEILLSSVDTFFDFVIVVEVLAHVEHVTPRLKGVRVVGVGHVESTG
jgi:hypothetical protein